MFDKDTALESNSDISDRIDEFLSDTIDRVVAEKGECKLSGLLKNGNDLDNETLKDMECNSLNLRLEILNVIHCIKCEDGEQCHTISQLLNTKLSIVANALSDKELLTEVLIALDDSLERTVKIN